jgi:excisionase family DNA binding protein
MPPVIHYHFLVDFIVACRCDIGVADMDLNGKWLTIDELAAYLKMGRTKLYRMAQGGELPGSKIGTQWRFDRDEIDGWVKSLRQTASHES